MNSYGIVIGQIFDAPAKGNVIQFTETGCLADAKPFRISRSKRNMRAAMYLGSVVREGDVWAWEYGRE